MTNAVVAQSGQVNGTGDPKNLYLKVYAGEVLAAFERQCVTQDKHIVRSIRNGKSAQFPMTGYVVAKYHTPGSELLGQATNQNERIITIDDMLVADVFFADIYEQMQHFDIRGEYSKKAGYALADAWDKVILQLMCKAARQPAVVTGTNGGTQLTGATAMSDAKVLANAIYSANQAMDEKDIPTSAERFAYVRPAQYYLMAQSTDLINRDWMGAGSYSDGTILRIAGSPIIKTNNLPNSNITTGPTKYQGDFSKTAAVVATREAAGTVKLINPTTRADYDPRRLGHLVTSKYAIGSDWLRPDCAVEIVTAATP
ncbi:phage capsid protein [Oxalobacter vibrioformis]|uniref:Phage capsid protein n=1 Tax=Oxalobacter vibrioformis TaxID=933080 RepID=A0A9E9LYS7_9BURK|nr:phage capsid protein [Oxalobacter vibrioformis]WAW09999.1 phage capsid protein [Oxalobacter vibrioformis]